MQSVNRRYGWKTAFVHNVFREYHCQLNWITWKLSHIIWMETDVCSLSLKAVLKLSIIRDKSSNFRKEDEKPNGTPAKQIFVLIVCSIYAWKSIHNTSAWINILNRKTKGNAFCARLLFWFWKAFSSFCIFNTRNVFDVYSSF